MLYIYFDFLKFHKIVREDDSNNEENGIEKILGISF